MLAVWIGKSDDSGTSNRICRAVNRKCGDLRMRCITLKRSVFRYQEDICIERDGDSDVRDLIHAADWIIQMGDDDYQNFWTMVSKYTVGKKMNPYDVSNWVHKNGKRLATRHAGTLFRENTQRYRTWDDRFGFSRAFYPCDLYRFGEADEKVMPFVQPQDEFASGPWEGDEISFYHTPSNFVKKGTVSIIEAMSRVPRTKFVLYAGHKYDDIVTLRGQHPVFIDQQNPHIGGFGGATMEAMAMAKVVITNDSFVNDLTDRFFPRPPTITVGDTSQLSDAIMTLRENPGRVREFSSRSLQWAKTYLGTEFQYQYYKGALA